MTSLPEPARWAHDPYYFIHDEPARQPIPCTVLNRYTKQVAGQAVAMAVIRIAGRPRPLHVAARNVIADKRSD